MEKQKIVASYQNFHVIEHDLDETENLNTECKEQLGEGVRLADWNDIHAYYREGGSIEDFIEALKIPLEYENPEDMDPIPNTSYRISRNGELRFHGNRHFFFARHDHKKRADFLPHSNINDYHLTLGSWIGKGGFALCYGDPDSSIEPSEPEINPRSETNRPASQTPVEPELTPVVSYQKFHVISHNLEEKDDLRAACPEKLGIGVRLADWNDILAYQREGGSIEDFINELNIPLEYINPEDWDPIPNSSYRISMNGELYWRGNRHFFFARHDHTKRADFLPHDDIDDFHLTLGSWFGDGGYALCFGDLNGTEAPPEPEINEQIETATGCGCGC